MTWEEFLTTKFELWTDTRSSTDNTLHGSGKTVEKSGILLRCSGSFVIYWSQRDFNHWKVKHFRPWSKWKAMAEQGLCWRILESKNILMSIKDLDNCEISTRNAITATPPPHLPPPSPRHRGLVRDQRLPSSSTQGASAKQDGDFPFLIWRCIILLPLQGHNIFVVLLLHSLIHFF